MLLASGLGCWGRENQKKKIVKPFKLKKMEEGELLEAGLRHRCWL